MLFNSSWLGMDTVLGKYKVAQDESGSFLRGVPEAPLPVLRLIPAVFSKQCLFNPRTHDY